MRTVQVTCEVGEYPVHIGRGLLRRAGDFLPMLVGKKAAVVTDDSVGPLYLQTVCDALRAAHVTPVAITVPQGEGSKCHEQLLLLYDAFLDAGLTRADAVVALGGGVVGDLAGYAAATYQRGVMFVQMPTTLLAQVDSSVGGKVAVNLPRGKNLVGAFHMPSCVIADLDTLATLPPRQLYAGMAEVIKYACLADAAMFAELDAMAGDEALLAAALPDLVARCIQIKADIVQADPFDKGIRNLLNFGHTWGHAVESAAGFGEVLHGEAVAVGMVEAARWGEALGVTPSGTVDRITHMLQCWHLPVQTPALPPAALRGALVRDKKAAGSLLTTILLEEMGRAVLHPLPTETVLALAFREKGERA